MYTTRAMAQHAMDIYDHLGEFAMVPFMMKNTAPDQSNEAWLQNGQLHLLDGSSIIHRKHAYIFSWYEDSDHYEHQRPAAMPVGGRPHVPDQDPNEHL